MRVAVASDRRLMAALIPNTSANSAITNPHINAELENNAVSMPGLVATPYAVNPVSTNASVIHVYTLRIKTGNAACISRSRFCETAP